MLTLSRCSAFHVWTKVLNAVTHNYRCSRRIDFCSILDFGESYATTTKMFWEGSRTQPQLKCFGEVTGWEPARPD
eukprot:3876950-Amphidinium_carterae.1